ncbi:MAG: ATP-binding protein [Desulfosarcinaceae bacterium]|nr:ATP-binding protein [Desulfosarcinaceae bacterium]
MQPYLQMVIENRLEALNHLMAVTRAYVTPYDLGGKSEFAVELILEEVVTNVIHHAFAEAASSETGAGTPQPAVAPPDTGDPRHLIAVRLSVSDKQVHLRVTDDGHPFNPLSAPRLDVGRPFMERLEGGIGIHLVRQMMNSMAYRREADRNIFEIWIRGQDGH